MDTNGREQEPFLHPVRLASIRGFQILKAMALNKYGVSTKGNSHLVLNVGRGRKGATATANGHEWTRIGAAFASGPLGVDSRPFAVFQILKAVALKK